MTISFIFASDHLSISLINTSNLARQISALPTALGGNDGKLEFR